MGGAHGVVLGLAGDGAMLGAIVTPSTGHTRTGLVFQIRKDVG